jgi:hypothetical protein
MRWANSLDVGHSATVPNPTSSLPLRAWAGRLGSYDWVMLARRASLPIRILLTALTAAGPPALLIGLVPALLPRGADGLAQAATFGALVWFTFAFFIAPAALLFDLIGPVQDDEDDEGGPRVDPPPPAPSGPGGGGPPLPDAEQSDTRLRDHGRPRRLRRARRQAEEPARSPVRRV